MQEKLEKEENCSNQCQKLVYFDDSQTSIIGHFVSSGIQKLFPLFKWKKSTLVSLAQLL